MRKPKFLQMFVLTLILFLGLGGSSGSVSAQGNSVSVKLPSFPVSLNGHVVDNTTRTYPLLVYRDITYVPMTWYDGRLLGLETSWSAQNGLSVSQETITGRYEPYASNTRNSSQYTARIVEGTVRINGELITNKAERYPLLIFRDVTYFPLTWRFAHDSFGWEYKWDSVKGLSITSNNIKVKETGLPVASNHHEMALFGDHYYYVQSKNVQSKDNVHEIYRRSVKSPNVTTKLYQYSVIDVNRLYTQVGFRLDNNQLLMSFQNGYENNFIFVNKDGTFEDQFSRNRASLDFRDTTHGKLVLNVGMPDETNGNLYLIKKNGSKQQIGDPQVTTFAQSAEKDGITPTVVVGNEVFALLKLDFPSQYVLYRINLVTGETKAVVEGVEWFEIVGGKLFYKKVSDKFLYAANLDGSGAVRISNHPVTWFDAVDDQIFYTSYNSAGKNELYKVVAGKGVLVLDEAIASVKVGNGQMLVLPVDTSTYGARILDANGERLWKVGEPIAQVYTSDAGWLVKSARDGRVLLVR